VNVSDHLKYYPGVHLERVRKVTEYVNWYNGHPGRNWNRKRATSARAGICLLKSIVTMICHDFVIMRIVLKALISQVTKLPL
jgi:hypothetical protein